MTLAPGQRTTVTLTVDREALAYYDDAIGQWVAEAGEFEALVGASSQDIRAAATFTLTETIAAAVIPRGWADNSVWRAPCS